MATIKELLEREAALSSGHRMCTGCTAPIIVKLVTLASKYPLVVSCATGCLEVATTIYPYTAWKCSFIHNAFENAAATLSGVETAYRALKKKGKIKDEIKFIGFAGDGGTYDIGLQALSGAMERGHDLLMVCVPPDTELIMDDGDIVQIGKFADSALRFSKANIITDIDKETKFLKQDSENIIQFKKLYTASALSSATVESKFESADASDSILSWDYKRGFVYSNIIRIQRKVSPPVLISLRTASGSILRLTPEHEVFIDSHEGPIKIPARYLRKGDEVYAPRKIDIKLLKEIPYIIDLLKEDISVSLPKNIRTVIIDAMKKSFGSVKKACRNLDLNHWQFKEIGRNIKLEVIRKICIEIPQLSWEDIKKVLKVFVVRGGRKIVISDEYLRLNEKIMYLLGLISSDGTISKTNYTINFYNKEQVLIENFKRIYEEMFTGRKISEFKDISGNIALSTANIVLKQCCMSLDIKTDPARIFSLSENLIAAYIRGFFDGDGYAGIITNKHSRSASVIFSTVDQILAKRLKFLLKRLGIAGFQDMRNNRFDITLSSRQDIITFFNKINSLHPKKQAALKKIILYFETIKERGRYFSIAPRICGRILKEIWLKYNISPSMLDKKRNISTIAANKSRATKNNIKRYIDKLRLYVNQKEPLLQQLEILTNNNFFLDPIVEIKTIPSSHSYVYDVTVANTHSFVPEAAFAISNCYDNQAYMNTGVQRSSATPMGAATTTSPAGKVIPGKKEIRKDITGIMVAHKIPYVAQASPSHWQDLVKKVEKALEINGPKFINVIMPCTLGWRFMTDEGIEIARLAVESCFWPLYEVENGKWAVTYKPKEKRPLIQFIETQGRFSHLKKEKNKFIIDEMQKEVDKDWEDLLKKEREG